MKSDSFQSKRLPKLLAALVIAVWAQVACGEQTGRCWKPIQLELTATGQHAWWQFPVRATFRRDGEPDSALTVEGFWNGETRWIVRAALPRAGRWSWRTESHDAGLNSEPGKKTGREVPWREAQAIKGSTQIVHAGRLLTKLDWWKLTPARDRLLVDGKPNPLPTKTDFAPPQAATLGSTAWIIYIPQGNVGKTIALQTATGGYSVRLINPRTGEESSASPIASQNDALVLPRRPSPADEDWVCMVSTNARAADERTHSVFSVKSDHTGTLLDGKPFLAVGLRCSNALVSEATTDDLIANLGTFAGYGVNTISVFLQGSRFGDVRGYREDASLDPVYAARMGRMIEAADARRMVVLVGCLYHGDSKGWWPSWKQADAERAIANTVRWLKEHDYRNVFVDVNNEHMAEFDDEKLIAAGKAVDASFVITSSGRVTPANADLSIHHGSPHLPDKYYIETEGTGGNYWGSYSKRPGLYDYINIGVYTDAMKQAMLDRTDIYFDRGQGYLFASTWLQNPPPSGPHHTPGGMGTKDDPGVRWWLEHIKARFGAHQPATTSENRP